MCQVPFQKIGKIFEYFNLKTWELSTLNPLKWSSWTGTNCNVCYLSSCTSCKSWWFCIFSWCVNFHSKKIDKMFKDASKQYLMICVTFFFNNVDTRLQVWRNSLFILEILYSLVVIHYFPIVCIAPSELKYLGHFDALHLYIMNLTSRSTLNSSLCVLMIPVFLYYGWIPNQKSNCWLHFSKIRKFHSNYHDSTHCYDIHYYNTHYSIPFSKFIFSGVTVWS
jgi:hypothetical protein